MNRAFLTGLARLSRRQATLLVAASLAIVGWIDLATGTEVRILALYFVPLLIAGWTLGVAGAACTAIAAAAEWVAALAWSGVTYATPYIWAINAVTEGAGFLVVAILVAELRKALDHERNLGRIDSLTGLNNRRAMVEEVGRGMSVCQRHGRAASLVCLDLNDFKRANDRFGHHEGDLVLVDCARAISAELRASDVVSRIGGDEFLIFLPETGAEQALGLMQRVRSRVDGVARLRKVNVTISMGIVSEMPITSTLEQLMQAADGLMYADKIASKNSAGRIGCQPE
jgi:diguanylate cyclase (GGDEF)-like protein